MSTAPDFDATAYLLATLDATTQSLATDLNTVIARATEAREALRNGQRVWSGVSTVLGQSPAAVEAGIAKAEGLLVALQALRASDEAIMAAYQA